MPALILVVDDESLIRDVLAEMLFDEGFRVHTAPDGQQALDQIGFEPPDLIISDVSMPKLDGVSLVHRLRERGDGMPVILMSARYVTVDLPGVRFIPKPFDIDHLAATVADSLDSVAP